MEQQALSRWVAKGWRTQQLLRELRQQQRAQRKAQRNLDDEAQQYINDIKQTQEEEQ